MRHSQPYLLSVWLALAAWPGSHTALYARGLGRLQQPARANIALLFGQAALPNDLKARIALIRSLLQSSQSRQASEFAARWRKEAVGSAALHVEIGIAFAEARVYADAIEEFRAALKQAPAQDDVMYNLALAYYYHQEFAEAERCSRQMLASKEAAAPRHLLGLVLERTGRQQEAKAEFAHFARLAPASADPYVHLGRIALEEKGYAEARRAFSEARARCNGTECVEALIGLGAAYKLEGAHEQATNAFREAIERAPKHAAGYLYLGDALIRARRYHDAATPLRKAVELDPSSSLGHYMLAYALMEAGLASDEAAFHLQEAIRLDPSNGLAYYRLGLLLGKAGDPRQAVPLLTKATALEPKLKEAHYQLGIALQKLGKHALAREEFAAYRRLSESAVQESSRIMMEMERLTE